MIGQLQFKVHGRDITVTLQEEQGWCCEDKSVESLLNEVCPTQIEAQHLADFQLHQLYRAGQRLGAEVQVPRQKVLQA